MTLIAPESNPAGTGIKTVSATPVPTQSAGSHTNSIDNCDIFNDKSIAKFINTILRSPMVDVGPTTCSIRNTVTAAASVKQSTCRRGTISTERFLSRSYLTAYSVTKTKLEIDDTRPIKNLVNDRKFTNYVDPKVARKNFDYLDDNTLELLTNGRAFLSWDGDVHYTAVGCPVYTKVKPTKMNLDEPDLDSDDLSSKASSFGTLDDNEKPSSVTRVKNGVIQKQTAADQHHTTPVGAYVSTDLKSPTIPVRTVSTTLCRLIDQFGSNAPWSVLAQAVQTQMMDTAKVGVAQITRAPTFKDGATIFSMTKFLMQGVDQWLEMAAIVRCLCMTLSTVYDGYVDDTTHLRFTRNCATQSVNMDRWISSRSVHDSYKITCCTSDIFNAIILNRDSQTNANMNTSANWKVSDLDTKWTMVPIRTSFLSNPGLVPYIASYLTSELWNGTVSHSRRVTWLNTSNQPLWYGVEGTMPVINSVYIHGPKNVMLVLMDENARDCSLSKIKVGNAEVTVRRSYADAFEEVEFYDIWANFWKNDNFSTIPNDCNNALTELSQYIAVDDTMHRSLGFVAELYGMKPLSIGAKYDASKYSWTPRAAYAVGTGFKLYDKTAITFTDITAGSNWITAQGKKVFMKKMAGYNFSSLSPLDVVPKSYAELNQSSVPAPVPSTSNTVCTKITSRWNESRPDFVMPDYVIPTTSSFVRFGIALGLLDTASHTLLFPNADGVHNFIHNASSALALSMGVLSMTNNICPRILSGLPFPVNNMDPLFNCSVYRPLTNGMVIGGVAPLNVKDGMAGLETIVDYYGAPLEGDFDYDMYARVPIASLIQWFEKLHVPRNLTPLPVLARQLMGDHRQMQIITEHNFTASMESVCSIDLLRTYAVISQRNPSTDHMEQRYQWFDQWEEITSNTPYDDRNEKMMSNAPTLYLINRERNAADTEPVYITTAIRTAADDKGTRLIEVDKVIYPDPPDGKGMFGIMRDYVVKPAVGAGTGFLAGGPVGAAIGAGAALLDSAVDDSRRAEMRKMLDRAQIQAVAEGSKASILRNAVEDMTSKVAEMQAKQGVHDSSEIGPATI